MPPPTRDALALGERYRIALAHTPLRGVAGQRLGHGTGASLEFQDRRQYEVGDDVRHLDWRAYARTDQLLVRQYREEIRPRLELLIDASRSMAVSPEKAQLATDVTALFATCARAQDFQVDLLSVGDRPERIPFERFEAEGIDLASRRPLVEALHGCRGMMRGGSLRVLVSDFLSPHDAPRLVRSLVGSAGRLALVQVLGPEDASPPSQTAFRLIDAESGDELEVVLDERSRDRYLDRLQRLERGLARECARVGGVFVTLTAGPSLAELCRGPLTGGGVLAPN